ncbi:MAG: sigma-70 family RNA polymerase sigma factor [Phycisphaerales bacterium]|nr:sigma-70 family RNA polymerase sigma factor [Phycisphaerales bacterium]
MTREELANLDDLALIDRINGVGGRGPVAAAAFTVLYERHRDFVLRVAMRTCGHEGDALDAAQDTFAYLFRKFPGFVLTAKLTTFLYPVVTHQAMAKRRARAKSLSGQGGDADGDPLDQQVATPRAEAMSDSRLQDLHAALAGLTPVHREVVMLRFVEGLQLEEIALAMQVPLGTVKSRLHLAISAMRQDVGVRRFFGVEAASAGEPDHMPSEGRAARSATAARASGAQEKADSA